MTFQVLDPDVTGNGVFERTDELSTADHETVVFGRDVDSGLQAIVSIHDTTLGPALGGTRFYPYGSEADALTDGLRLSQGMTLKAAAAGLPFGGGKAVIIGDPAAIKSPDLLRSYGRLVQSLGGSYITAADVGTTSDDLDVVGEVTEYVVGRSQARGGSGDSGFSTAYGVFCSMQAAATFTWGPDGLAGRTVGVEGLGKVGFHLVGLLLDAGAEVSVSDPSAAALQRSVESYRDVRIARTVISQHVDIYAPCALGATLTKPSTATLQARIVCGAANNQLLDQSVDGWMAALGVLWVPDFVANAGGLIQVGGERQNKTEDEVLLDVARIAETVTEILEASSETGTPTGQTAIDIANRRLQAARSGGST